MGPGGVEVTVIQKKFEGELVTFKKLQKDLTKTTSLRSQLDGQLNENKVVKEELDLLESTAVVYKLIGPALIKQDLEEARQNVNKRIDYIQQEMKRHDNCVEDMEKKADEKRECISKLQQQMQAVMIKQQGSQ